MIHLSVLGGALPSDLRRTILVQIAASLVIAVLAVLWRRLSARLALRDPRIALTYLFVVVAVWCAAAAGAMSAASSHEARWWREALLFAIPTLALGYFFLSLASGVWRAGIHGGDRRIRHGLDYSRALQLVHTDLSFLGTSAAKLTSTSEFEPGVLRCQSHRPLRFLLMQPDDRNLTTAAQRSGRDRDEYKHVALRSLRTLQDLRNNRGVTNLEVRFYDTSTYQPIFRLMFIDDSLCLASYNVYGRGDGSDSPQLHVVRATDPAQSFYFAFDHYFENLWDRSQPWDYHRYLDHNE